MWVKDWSLSKNRDGLYIPIYPVLKSGFRKSWIITLYCNWAIIATRFRCAHSIYNLVMQVVCGLVNQQTQRWQAANSQAVG
jgi:hypothetical protein